jgi:hypothetical protein
MSLYFFHVRDGVDLPDLVGTECADLMEAQSLAISTCGAMIKELGKEFWDAPEDWQMNVTDAAGAAQFTLRFSPR